MLRLTLKFWESCTDRLGWSSTAADSKVTLPPGCEGTMFNSWRGHDSRWCFNTQVKCFRGAKATALLHDDMSKCAHFNYSTLEVGDIVQSQKKKKKRSILRKKAWGRLIAWRGWETVFQLVFNTHPHFLLPSTTARVIQHCTLPECT